MSSAFEKDLEFVQLLCNPEYLKWLHCEKYFKRNDFKDYLKYLLYFRKQEYSRFLVYPQCIPILEAISRDNANELLSSDEFYNELARNQYNIWKNRDGV